MAWEYECNGCGEKIRAQSEDELRKKVHQHQDAEHNGEDMSDKTLDSGIERL